MVEIEPIEMSLEKLRISPARSFVVAGIPAFNEEKAIARVVLDAEKFADVVVVCDDGSRDMTAAIAERLGADVVKHKQNGGYGSAIRSLFERARELGADVLVTLDADGQHDPSEIPNVIKPIVEGTADVVIGSRFIDDNGTSEMPKYRRIGAQLITKMVNGSSENGVTDSQSGFRAYSREALDCLEFFEVGMGASVEILLEASKQNLKIYEVPSTCKYQNGNVGTSTEHPISHGVGVVMSVVRLIVEERPLTVLGVPGLLCMFAGLFFGVWMLQIYATEHQIITNIALASLAFALIGLFAIFTSVTLYAILRQNQKLTRKC